MNRKEPVRLSAGDLSEFLAKLPDHVESPPGYEERRNAARKLAIRQWAEARGFPVRSVEAGLVARTTPSIERLCESLEGNTCPLVILVGPPGTGKTVACVAAVLQRKNFHLLALDEGDQAVKGIDARFTSAYRWSTVVAAWDQGKSPETAADLLIVDDLGREPPAKRRDLEELILDRYENRPRTWITANLTDDELGRLYDGRLISRASADGMILHLTEVLREHRIA